MPRLTLWKPDRTNDYQFIDNRVRETIELGGTGVYIHKYLGPEGGESETDVDDVLFMENRSRKYDDIIYNTRGHYEPANADFDLTQFGLFLSNDIIFLEFHLIQLVEMLGRKIIAGDVLELPHLREFFSTDPDKPAFNKFFVVEDAFKGSGGFDPHWWPHIWRVKAKTITASEEFSDILGSTGEKILTDSDGNEIGTIPPEQGHGGGQGDGTSGDSLIDIMSSASRELELSEAAMDEAECEVKYDPTYFEGYHYYIHFDCNDNPLIYYGTGDGIPPNSIPLLGEGDEFPEDMEDDDYFLRTDFEPEALFRKDGCKYIRVEVDMRRPWTAQNQLLDSFIDNDNITEHDDGTTEPERQALSKVVLPGAEEKFSQTYITGTQTTDDDDDTTNTFGPEFGPEFE